MATQKSRAVIAAQAAYVALVTDLTAGVVYVQNVGHSGVLEVIVAASAPADAAAGTQLNPGQSAVVLNNGSTNEIYVKSFDEATDVFAEVRYDKDVPVLNALA